jgi:hypothetical protein
MSAPIDWNELATQFRRSLDNGSLRFLADQLKVKEESLRALDVGWNVADHSWTFPERAGRGKPARASGHRLKISRHSDAVIARFFFRIWTSIGECIANNFDRTIDKALWQRNNAFEHRRLACSYRQDVATKGYKMRIQRHFGRPLNRKPSTPIKPPQMRSVDLRRQLFNDRMIGPVEAVQLPAAMITQLWGILLDIDLQLFRQCAIPDGARNNPRVFYQEVARPWLQRDPALRDAEVVLSGQGLHIIIWLAAPVVFDDDGERQRWAGIVKAIQAVLPADPDAPGITALTRARGSINSKNGVIVERLSEGKPVKIETVLDLFERLRTQPFRTVMTILFGSERRRPCPVCDEDNSTLSSLDFAGRCYGSCGNVKLDQLYEVFLKPRPAPQKVKQ